MLLATQRTVIPYLTELIRNRNHSRKRKGNSNFGDGKGLRKIISIRNLAWRELWK